MSDRLTLPVLPLREVVLFPGVTTQIGAGRPGTLKAIEAALKGPDKLVFAVSQLENLESVSPDNLYEIGTIARIGQLQRGLSGMQLLLHGEQRGVCVHYEDRDGHLVAVVRPVDEMQPLDAQDPAFIAMHREVRARAAELGQKSGLPEEVVRQVLEGVDDPGRFADLVAGYIEITSAQRQALLQTFSVEERLRRVLVHVQRQIGVADAQEQIKADVQEELGERQKEMFLREQLKQIRRQLGDEDQESDLDELREKLAMLELDEVVRKEVDRELGRLERVNKDSTEAQVIRTFLETVAELPWNVRSEEKLELAAAQQILDADHYALGDVKDRVLEFLAVRQLRAEKALQATAAKAEATEAIAAQENEGSATPEPASATAQREIEDVLVAETAEARKEAKGPILLFIGPPGVGKTSVAKSIARAMGRKYVRISLGGARDEADIRGHRRTYVGAMPGRIIQGLKQAGTKNPVFLLDEIDKLGVSYQGDPSSALLEVLDPAQNDAFVDHYLGIPFDLSEVLFVATANFIQNIPGPLLDRMELVDFSSYTEREKKAIARTYLLPRQMEENGVDEARFEINDEALATLISGYTREAGVRQLERELGKVARKVARRLAAKEVTRVAVTPADLGTMLGRPRVHPEQAARADEIGVATGMYYTPVGGDIMFVEASTMRGKGELVLTGQLGDVMKESARAAWTYARAHALGLRIPDDMFERDLHIHVPAGAIPKDGPSAGVAMATTIVSALSGRPVRHDIAMTGEITLRGTVLPIGGVKEKILGAVRAGITKVILPKDNERDLDDLPREVRDMLEIHLVSDLGDALARTLRGASYREGRLLFGDEKPADVSPLQTAYH